MKDINEIIDFIELSGDKAIILHQEKGAFVVMKMEHYKDLANLRQKQQEIKEKRQPDTDVRLYEIRRQEEEDDRYYPEPVD